MHWSKRGACSSRAECCSLPSRKALENNKIERGDGSLSSNEPNGQICLRRTVSSRRRPRSPGASLVPALIARMGPVGSG